MLFHSTLAFSLQDKLGWVNLVMRSNQKWACMFAFVFHVPALPWVHLSFEAAHCLKKLCLCVRLKERERESGRARDGRRVRSIEGSSSFDHAGVSPMSCTFRLEHLRYHHRCGLEWEAGVKGKALFTVSVYGWWGIFFSLCSVIFGFIYRVDIWLIMLNILLSALIDPDRRLRSFRRSERLASILVCILLGACLTLLCLFCVLCKIFMNSWGKNVSVFHRHIWLQSWSLSHLSWFCLWCDLTSL